MEYPISNYGNKAVIAWCPTSTSLQIRSKTTLLKTSPTAILDVATQKSYQVTFKPNALYSELYPIISSYVSFEDMQYSAIQQFWGIEQPLQFPATGPIEMSLLTNIHHLTDSIKWASGSLTGYCGLITPKGSLSLYPVPDDSLYECLAYGFAKLGYTYDGGSIKDVTSN